MRLGSLAGKRSSLRMIHLNFLSARSHGRNLAFLLGVLGLLLCPNLPAQTPRTYTNPVYKGSMPDPSVIRVQGVYYAFGTTGKERKADGRIFTLLRSTNLVDWEELGGAVTPPSANPNYEYWAPEAMAHKGKFYVYYAMGGVEPERFVNRVAMSDKPEGPYTDAGEVDGETNRFTIDPFPFRDSGGQMYFFYACNFPFVTGDQHPGTGIKVDHLTDMRHLAGEGQTVVRARHDWTLYESNRWMEVYGKTFDWHTIEGPCVVKHEGKYYCFYSGANWQTPRYGLDYVVADQVMGPYRDQGTSARVLHGVPGHVRGPGHHSIVFGPDGKTQYVVYHAWDPGMTTRQLCVDKLDWTPAGPRCTPTWTPMPVP